MSKPVKRSIRVTVPPDVARSKLAQNHPIELVVVLVVDGDRVQVDSVAGA